MEDLDDLKLAGAWPASISAARKAEMLKAGRQGAREVFRLLLPKVLDAGEEIDSQLIKLGRKYGIDPDYLRFTLGRGHLWPSMTPEDRKLVGLAAEIVKAGGSVPSYKSMSIPEAELEDMAMDLAFMDLGSWMALKLAGKLDKAYTDAGWEVASKYTHILTIPGDPADPRLQAAGMIQATLKHQLARGGFGSPHKYVVLGVLQDLLNV